MQTTFHGLKFGDNGILDMSQNKLQVLHAGRLSWSHL